MKLTDLQHAGLTNGSVGDYSELVNSNLTSLRGRCLNPTCHGTRMFDHSEKATDFCPSCGHAIKWERRGAK